MFANGRIFYGWQLVLILTLFGLALSSRAISNPAGLKLENELLLDLRIDGERLGLDILGYQRGDEFLLSLDELASGLGFAIAVDAEEGVASGWYISEDRTFTLDMARAEVISGDQRWPINAGEVELFENDLYVETSTLEAWFPVQLFAVVRELYLDVVPTELLPIQQRLNRRKRVFTSSSSSNIEPRYPLQPNPYRFIGSHITDLRMGYATSRQNLESDANYSGNYAWLSRGDLGWMTSTFSFAGRSDDELAAARFKLERTDIDGPLGLNHIEVGDVGSNAFRGISLQGSSGSGSQDEGFDNESVTIEGNQLPDWDVEIYQNDQLIAIQTIEQDGRYFFEDVPLLFGENQFELRFYGPNGEFESREETHFLGPSMLDTGQVSYEASAVQRGITVLGVNDIENEEQGGGIYGGSVNVGILPNLTLGAGISSQKISGERFASSSVGLSLGTSRFHGSVRYSDGPFSQNTVSSSLRTRLGNTNLNFQFIRYLDDPLLISSVSNWQSNLDIATTLLNKIPVKVELTARDQENSSQYEAVLGTTIPLSGSGRLSTSLWHSASEERFAEESTVSSFTGGQTSINTSIRPWSFRLSTSYALQPDMEISQLAATSNLSIDNNMSLSLGIRQVSATDITHYSGGINWRFDRFAISTQVTYDSDERWSGLITLGTTLIHQPGSFLPRLDRRASVSSGSVEARVFLDGFDSERQAVEGANVNAVQNFRKGTTNASGVAFLSPLPANRQTDIELDESTLSDYALRSSNSGVSVISRPGSYAIVEFPIIRTAELEGHISVDVNGQTMPVVRALVSLKTPDGDVVTQTRTAFDGFYLFEGVEPGDYLISLESPLEKRVMKRPAKVTVTSISGVIAELDYRLRPALAQNIEPTGLAQDNQSLQGSDNEATLFVLPALAGALPEPETDTPPLQPAEQQASEPETAVQNEPRADNGNWFVQIGAYDSRAVARASWDRISQAMQALQGKTARFMAYQSMTRLLVGPGSAKNAATSLCQQLKAQSLDCMVRRVE